MSQKNKDAAFIAFAPLVLVLVPLCRIAVIAIRLFIYWFIIVGALDEITSRKYTVQIISYILLLLPESLSAIAGAIYTHWMQCAVLIIFLQSWHRKKDHDELMETSNYMKMFIATMMTYFEVQVETKEMIALDKGVTSESLVKGFKNEILAWFLRGGQKKPDSLLNAYPVRGQGNRVTFEEDIKRLISFRVSQ